jgi:hypothetical protein
LKKKYISPGSYQQTLLLQTGSATITERESPGTRARRGSGGKRGWFTPAGSDMDPYVTGDP